MNIRIGGNSDELQDCPDYWYVCPACGDTYNVQIPEDEPPKSPFNCRCGTPVILCDDSDESD